MKIGKKTFEIMKNFTAINNSLWVNEPTCMKTLSIAENIIGIYDTEEEFPEFALYNSVPFMSIINLFELENVDFDFGENSVIIKTKSSRVSIVYDDHDIIPKLGDLKESSVYKSFSDFDAVFDLKAEQINFIQKAANILGMPDMTVVMQDKKGMITITDDENPDSSTFKTPISGEGDCKISMMVKNLQIIPGDYTVSISNGKMTKFHHKKITPLFYIVAAKKD